ncbi:glycosyltransferase family 4 protein [Dyella sp. BiH032]|uniref:glycosyltransferase family 4 protein n=1 Tax=Dyella sp. BiH032 TaxID=3075430 RepID=UPI00289326D5|nr:glycosyltransferase family 4 protein [Dyella sp. BiH032]WNL44361.1 glycosyltransferase family 4 protein [Dyella sp. BiH032]
MHVTQLNLVPAPEDVAPADLLDRWPSLPDIAEAAAGAGVRVSVIQAAARDARVERHGIAYRFLPLRGDEGSRRLAAEVAGLGADVVHVHGLDHARQAHALSARLPWLPILLQDHANRPPRWWRRMRWRRWFGAASAVTFTSMEQARPFTEARLFAPATRLFAIPESTCRFTPGALAAARAQTGLHGHPCVVWVGHLDANKDPLTVLDGVALAARRLPGLRLWCAYGHAPLLDEVRARIAADPVLASRVHLLGPVPHGQVQSLLRAADLFVSGSRSESCGYAALEAMACGVPPVLTDIPAFRALTAGGGVGRLWQPGDAAQLAEALVAMATHGPSRERVRAHFDAELSFGALGRRWADAYGALLPARRSVA